MAVVPGTHDFGSGAATSTEMNAFVRDPLRFLLSPPIAELRQTAAQSIPNATYTAVAFNAEDVDSAGGHDNVTNNSRYTAVYPGWYQVSGASGFVANAAGRRITGWAVNGTTLTGSQLSSPNTGGVVDINVAARTMLAYLNVTDYVELLAYQDSGGALNTNSALATTTQGTMTVRWVSS